MQFVVARPFRLLALDRDFRVGETLTLTDADCRDSVLMGNLHTATDKGWLVAVPAEAAAIFKTPPTPEKVLAALLRHPALAFEVATLLQWIASPWKERVGHWRREDPFGKEIAGVYDHQHASTTPPGRPFKWIAWIGDQQGGYSASPDLAKREADECLVGAGWTLV